MKVKKGYKSVLLIALTLLALILITNFGEPHPWAAVSDPLQEQGQSGIQGYNNFQGINTPWCSGWISGLEN